MKYNTIMCGEKYDKAIILKNARKLAELLAGGTILEYSIIEPIYDNEYVIDPTILLDENARELAKALL